MQNSNKKPTHTADEAERTFKVSLVTGKATYDYDAKAYIPAKGIELTWSQIVRLVTKKTATTKSKDGWGIIPSHIRPHIHPKGKKRGPWRRKDGCTETSLLILDVEHHDIGGDEVADVTAFVRSKFPNTKALIYTSWNHGSTEKEEDGTPKWVAGQPRFRVIIPLSQPVDSQADWTLVYKWVIDHCDGAVDTSCKDPCRLSYLLRARNPQAILEPFSVELEGDLLDPERLPGGASLSEMQAEQKAQEELRRQQMEHRRNAIERGHLDVDMNRAQKYAKATLEGACADIRQASQGERHVTIYDKAFRLGTMVAADGVINEGDVIIKLHDAACDVLPADRHDEAERTIKDAIGDAQGNPFDVTELATLSRTYDLTADIDWSNVRGGDTIGFDGVTIKEGGA